MSSKSKKQSFSITHPHLLEEWDYRKNQLLCLEPEKLTVGSHKKVWWKCEKDHSWKAIVCNRAIGSRGCPYCSGNKAGYGNDLLTNHPDLCEEWDFEKNELGPENYLPGSHKKAWWVCEKEHSWEAVIKNRTRNGNSCPYCSNQKVGYGNDLLTNHPDLCKEWDFNKNKQGPENYMPCSNSKVWWVCSRGHSWEAAIFNRTRGSACPFCSGRRATAENSFVVIIPELCEEWDYEKNKLGPENYLPKSNKKVWWKCLQEHSWSAQISNRQDGNGCPYCSGRKVGYGNDLLTNHPDLCREWDFEKNKLGPENYLPGSGKKVWWKCSEGHSWCAQINSRTKGIGCPKCFKESSVSKASQEWLDSLGVEQREVQIGKYYVDGYDPETNTVYEFFGDYWHGNPKVFSAGKINPTSKKSFGALYKNTMERVDLLKKAGYKVVYVWENDFKEIQYE